MDENPAQNFYRPGHREIQDRFDSRRLADRLAEVTLAATFSAGDRRLIAAAPFLWLSTADAEGWPDVSYKGGRPGFVHLLDDNRLAFPSYDGNGMFRSLGNITENPRVGLLFCDFDQPWRIRVKGLARLVDEPDVLRQWPGAQVVVEVTAQTIFPNCGRYVHRSGEEPSVYAPDEGYEPPSAEWKSREAFAGHLPRPNRSRPDGDQVGP